MFIITELLSPKQFVQSSMVSIPNIHNLYFNTFSISTANRMSTSSDPYILVSTAFCLLLHSTIRDLLIYIYIYIYIYKDTSSRPSSYLLYTIISIHKACDLDFYSSQFWCVRRFLFDCVRM